MMRVLYFLHLPPNVNIVTCSSCGYAKSDLFILGFFLAKTFLYEICLNCLLFFIAATVHETPNVSFPVIRADSCVDRKQLQSVVLVAEPYRFFRQLGFVGIQ